MKKNVINNHISPQPPTQKSNLSGFGADAWATAAVTPAPAVNVMSAFDDLDPLRK